MSTCGMLRLTGTKVDLDLSMWINCFLLEKYEGIQKNSVLKIRRFSHKEEDGQWIIIFYR